MCEKPDVRMRRHSIRAWIRIFRPFSYTAAIVPVLLGAAMAVYGQYAVRWPLFPLIILASVCLQAGTNLINEYFDFKNGVDRPEICDSSHVLVEGLLPAFSVLVAGWLCFALTGAIGLIFVALCGWPILLIGMIGMAGGFFYTAAPVAYKYWGIGDLAVFCLMGPLMVIGCFFVLTGGYQADILWISLPVGFLVAAILSANNLRDLFDDRRSRIRTPATILGHRWARWEYAGLIGAAFGVVGVLVLSGVLPAWSLLTLVTVPLAVRNIRIALQSHRDTSRAFVTLDAQTAKLHLLFGLLLIVSVMLAVWI